MNQLWYTEIREFFTLSVTGESFKRTKDTRTHSDWTFLPLLNDAVCISVLQMEVVSTFKRSGSFQGAVRRRSSVLSQLHDVNTISTPSHVALSTATANTSPAPGSESAERMYTHTEAFVHTCTHSHTHSETQKHTLAPTQPPTHCHTAARHVDCSILTLYGCVPPARSLLVLCAMCPLFFALILPFKQHPILPRLCSSGIVWSGPNPLLVPGQRLFLLFVSAGGS